MTRRLPCCVGVHDDALQHKPECGAHVAVRRRSHGGRRPAGPCEGRAEPPALSEIVGPIQQAVVVIVLHLTKGRPDPGVDRGLESGGVMFGDSLEQEALHVVALNTDLAATAVRTRAADERRDTAERVADKEVVAEAAEQRPASG